MAIALTVNGRAHTLDVDPATPLLYVLSDDLALNGPKFGCGLGQCGACTVIARGRAVRSCVSELSCRLLRGRKARQHKLSRRVELFQITAAVSFGQV